MSASKTPLFALGRLVATPGAMNALHDRGLSAMELFLRHQRGDWGDLDAGDIEANRLALLDGSRLLSAYDLGEGWRVWVITEADRRSTCLLLPDEY